MYAALAYFHLTIRFESTIIGRLYFLLFGSMNKHAIIIPVMLMAAGNLTQTFAATNTVTKTISYQSPAGSESIKLSITAKDGIITAASATPFATDSTSLFMQKGFAEKVSGAVVWKAVKGLKVDTISGASLTTGAFNIFLANNSSSLAAIPVPPPAPKAKPAPIQTSVTSPMEKVKWDDDTEKQDMHTETRKPGNIISQVRKSLLSQKTKDALSQKLDAIPSENRTVVYGKILVKIDVLIAKYKESWASERAMNLLQEVRSTIQDKLTSIDDDAVIDEILSQ